MTPGTFGLLVFGCLVGMAMGALMLRREPLALGRLSGPSTKPRRSSLTGRLSNYLGRRFGPTILATMSDARRLEISHRLDVAGHPGGLTLEGYAARKASYSGLMLIVGVIMLLLTSSPLMVLALPALAWYFVDFSVAGIARRRTSRIDRDLPDFMDILTVTVGAGLTFRNGLARVAQQIDSPISEEVRLTLQQMSFGASRREAFEALRDRSDSDNLRRFVRELLQAEELGAPLSDALQTIAVDMRQSFGQDARRRAAKAQPKVSLLITTTVVPGAIILIVGGMLLANRDAFSGLFGA